MTTSKRILIVCRKAPYGNLLSREALDIALATAVFDQQLSLVFTGDGVWQLLKDQHSESIEAKNHGKLISAFPHYDIEDIYIDSASMAQRNITVADLIIDAKTVDKTTIAELMEKSDSIFNF
ncbi:MAG: sulfurtransferase complex subunit TusC [Pseudomonadales bacterium]